MKKNFFLTTLLIWSLTGCSTVPSLTPTQNELAINKAPTRIEAQNISAQARCSHTETSFQCVKVVEIYDGDTIFIDLPDQHPLFGKRMGVRIVGIDTPELKTKDACEKKRGQEAKAVLADLLGKAKRVDIVNVEKDKFFRILGTVLADGHSVSNDLIQRRLAYPYHGERKIKRNWCK